MNRTKVSMRATLCVLTLVALAMAVACGGDKQPPGATAGASAPTGTMTEPTLGSSGGGAPSVAGSAAGRGEPTPAGGSAGSPVSAAAGTMASAGSPGSAAAGATSTAAGAGGASTAAGSGGAPTAPPAGVACDPKDKTPEPTAVSFKVIVGYDKLEKPPTTGPLQPVIEVHSNFPEWTVYRPEPLDANTKHPIVVFGNGGCLLNGTLFGQWTFELASYGIVSVVDGKPAKMASGDPAANGIRPGPDGKPLVMAMDWITAENERPCSPFYHKLDVTKIGIAGQSCGGMMTLMAAGDKRVASAMVFNSGLSGSNATLFASYHAPMLFLAGGSSDFLSTSATANVSAITKVPIWYGNLPVGHMSTWAEKNAGEMGRVATGWVRWKLQGDATTEKWFVGADCELCKPPSMWMMIQKKMID